MYCNAALILGAFCLERPEALICFAISDTGASLTSSQVGKRRRSVSNERAVWVSVVAWLSIVAISCETGSRPLRSGSP
jgi:hypothetical protein